MTATPKPNDIIYIRARVCSRAPEMINGRECVMVEPIQKDGSPVVSAWSYTVPSEWTIPLSTMRLAIKQSRATA